jgi:nitroimidazol reductase NimA-like FMN-containing flavoprotein (pyridoxamine 5'-phosphate oxidase superfamily)
MRRKELEITDRKDIDEIIAKAKVCHLGMSDGDKPYVVPMCFGYDGKSLFFHSSPKGQKIDTLRKNGNVCFEISIMNEVVEADQACDFEMKYQSVIGFGTAEFLQDIDEKRQALDCIVKQYTQRKFEYPPQMIKGVAVIKVEIEGITGKASG